MKRSIFITIFISIHILFVGLQIHKHGLFVQLSYQKQKQEKLKDELLQRKQELAHQLHAAKAPTLIKQYVVQKNGMERVKLAQIKRLSND
jgi:Tfp pilus assembly protein PilO